MRTLTTLSLLVLAFNLCGQDIMPIIVGGDSTFCPGSKLTFSISHEIKEVVRYEWFYNGKLKPDKDSTINLIIENDVGAIDVICNLYTYRSNYKSYQDSLIRTGTLKNRVYSLPKLSPKYYISGNSVLLAAGTSNNKYDLSWIGPNTSRFKGNLIQIDTPKIEEFGTYKLIALDTTGCKSTFELVVKPEDQVESKPSTVFGTIDGFDEDDNLLRIVERDIPVYLSELDGTNRNSEYQIAYKNTRWQIIGEIDNYYLIQFQTNYINQKEQDTDRERISSELDVLETKLKSAEIEFLDSINNHYLQGEISGLKKQRKKLRKELKKLPNSKDREEFFNFREHKVSGKRKYFLVDRADFLSRSKPYRYISNWPPKFTAGTVLIPVKLRSNDFEFSKDITLGPFVGAKLLLSSYNPTYISAGFTAGISSVRLTPENSDSTRVSTVTDLAAFSYSFGIIYENSRVQVGAFIGADLINNNKDRNGVIGYDWNYQNKLWVSIGLGFSIINRPSNKSADKGN